MAYIINTYNTAQLTVVEDGTIDQTTDLKLVGKNYAGYGEIQNENFVFLLENFAGANEPPKALSGQIWFDNSNNKLKFYDGTQWRTSGGSEVGASAPAGLTQGDFWWDSQNEQLYVYNGTEFLLIGPQGAGENVTQFQSRSVRDTDGVNRPIIVSVVNDEVIHIISNVTFTIGTEDATNYPGFDKVHEGLTLKNTINTTSGVTSTAHRWWGTATNADRLGGYTSDKFIRYDNATFSAEVAFGDTGIKIGNEQDVAIRVINDNVALIGNEQGVEMIMQVKSPDNNIRMPIRFTHDKILPGYAQNIDPASSSFVFSGTNTVDIGSSTDVFQSVYATTFEGTATKSNSFKATYINAQSEVVTTEYFAADARPTAGVSIVARDLSGDIWGNLFRGIATSAQYADLAEMYTSDKDYEPGTVLVIGDTAEVTESTNTEDYKVIGVVSTNPAHLMNSELQGMKVAVALRGRVPCKVIGPISKGDLLITSDIPGVAKSADKSKMPHSSCIIGKSLESFESNEIGMIEIVV